MNAWKWVLVAVAALAVAAVVLFVLPLKQAHAQIPGMTLEWTAPGDDGMVGTATTFEMRWGTVKPDTTSEATKQAWWNAATVVPGMPTPLIAGSMQSVTVSPPGGFTTGRTYFFMVRACDEVPNCGRFSNVARQYVADADPPGPILNLTIR